MHRKLKTLLILSALVIIIPFLGVPVSWRRWVLVLIGAALVWIVLSLRRALEEKQCSNGNGVWREQQPAIPVSHQTEQPQKEEPKKQQTV